MDRSTGTARYAVGRTEEFAGVLEKYDPATDAWIAWDVSDASLSIRFRAYKRPAGSKAAAEFDVDQDVDKVNSGTDGEYAAFVTFATARALVECEIVVIDATVNNAATPSGKREVQVRVWDARVEAALAA